MAITLEAQWHRLTGAIVPDASLRQATLAKLTKCYTAPERHYHSLVHIQDLLQTIDQHAARLHDADVVRLAAWFHDAVYSSMRQDNEARSAVLAREFLRHSTWPALRQERVAYLIERTKDHTLPQPAADTDLHFFLDADLQVLGRPEAEYWHYARQIRQEYRLVPDFMYRSGRSKVLEKLLASAPLYRTAAFRERLEEPARRNLRAELLAWEQGGL
ncbi:hypothetical protein FY528_02955 [Hymenobacter lutimineralis]|uniref:Metal-dependent phosphohydrolase n=1 Tax=Hymenobacter lutimineralis TaxID=2606448 RepID=A0A5D6VDH1_9BACT|nr:MULTISPECIES: hypothetical protein [Hymenobacter]QIX61168.1 hypothetical protein HER32_08235 [Hymenobacter sp. BT18]TYZ13385.1 hypothetical protein FY528_02955 [Hymenobacter lutimineralis]